MRRCSLRCRRPWGATVWQFATDSRTEVRKVVWPTRQETLQTLLIITIAVLADGAFMWLVDSVLFGIVRYLTRSGRLNMAKRWYVVHAYSGFEGPCEALVAGAVDPRRMQDAFGEILVPTEEGCRDARRRPAPQQSASSSPDTCWCRWNDRRHLASGQDVPKVMGFIGGTGDRPAPITDKEADAILQRMQEGVDKPKPRCCSSRARWCASSTGRSMISMAWSRRSTTTRAA